MIAGRRGGEGALAVPLLEPHDRRGVGVSMGHRARQKQGMCFVKYSNDWEMRGINQYVRRKIRR